MDNSISKKITNATKWSVATEVAAKLIAPISNMVLARLLTPEAFGVVATVTMITSFADMFTDAGFQKYLVQHEFSGAEDQEESTTVAFWTNMFISLLLWGIIIIKRDALASIVGNPGLGYVVAIACVSLPLTSFSSIQMALFRRNFDFKTLFMVRLLAISIPIVVTIPLAFLLRSYWALIIGTMCINLLNAFVLTYKSSWKPRLYYSFSKLKEMISFSIWTLLEQISIWLTSYIGTFIVGSILSAYYVGVYKTSMVTVNQIMTLITSATTPVLFSALSRTQNEGSKFDSIFFQFQKNVAIFVVPLGTGIYLYKNLLTKILLGSQWSEAADFIGLWGLMSAITIVFSHFSSEVYRAKGKPRLSFIAQILHLIVLIPILIISGQHGFSALYLARSYVRLQLVLVNLIIMDVMFHISIVKQISNVLPEIIATLFMTVIALILQQQIKSTLSEILSVGVCIVSYFSFLFLFPKERYVLMNSIKSQKEKICKRKK